MHHIKFVFFIKGKPQTELEVNHEFGPDLLALPNKKIVHFMRVLRQFIYHSLLIPIKNKQVSSIQASDISGYITIELTGELALSSQDYVLEAILDPKFKALSSDQQARIFSALIMFIDQAGVMFVRQSSANKGELTL